jgi:hypothetical protein
MSMWLWLAAGVGALLAVSTLTGLLVAAVLGRMGSDLFELLDPNLVATTVRTPRARPESAPEDEALTRDRAAPVAGALGSSPDPWS